MEDAGSRGKPGGSDKRGILQVLWGKQAFKKIVLEPGQSITLGRTDRADVLIDDPEMSALHFQVWFAGASAVVRDLDSQGGTLINGAMVPRERIGHGGFVVAGTTTFQLFVEESTPPTDEPPSEERLAVARAVEEKLGAPDGDLFGVFDAARDDRILFLLQESIDEHQNLYEGVPGRALDQVAPYLVRFTSESSLLGRLLVGGWGRGWGTFFKSHEPMKEVRRHFRRYLIVQEEATLERLYFRYYDPRVLREFLKVATPRQRGELLAPFTRVMFEGEDAELVEIEGGAQHERTEEDHVPHS